MYSIFINVNSRDILHNIGIHKNNEHNSALTTYIHQLEDFDHISRHA
jgi:hypothetical protein